METRYEGITHEIIKTLTSRLYIIFKPSNVGNMNTAITTKCTSSDTKTDTLVSNK